MRWNFTTPEAPKHAKGPGVRVISRMMFDARQQSNYCAVLVES